MQQDLRRLASVEIPLQDSRHVTASLARQGLLVHGLTNAETWYMGDSLELHLGAEEAHQLFNIAKLDDVVGLPAPPGAFLSVCVFGVHPRVFVTEASVTSLYHQSFFYTALAKQSLGSLVRLHHTYGLAYIFLVGTENVYLRNFSELFLPYQCVCYTV